MEAFSQISGCLMLDHLVQKASIIGDLSKARGDNQDPTEAKLKGTGKGNWILLTVEICSTKGSKLFGALSASATAFNCLAINLQLSSTMRGLG